MKFRTAKIAVIVSTLCLQVATTPALQAATLDDASSARYNAQMRTGAFAGARIRLAMGSQKREPRLRAGLTFATMQSGQTPRGASLKRFGEGLEFGINSRNSQPHMSIAGYTLTSKRLGAVQDAQGDNRGSTLRTAAFVVGGILLAGAVIYGSLVIKGSKNTQ